MVSLSNHPAYFDRLTFANFSSFTRLWWIAFYPGLAITIAVLAFNLFGDSLRDVLDPRLRNR